MTIAIQRSAARAVTGRAESKPSARLKAIGLMSALVPALALTPAVPFVWRMPEHPISWLLLAGTGLFGAVGHWLLTVAHRLAPASVLMPFTYSQILWVVLLSYVVFRDVPSATTLLGAGIVIASGLYLLYRERVRKRA